jgi:GNAT superfamily N-acetyltransferase
MNMDVLIIEYTPAYAADFKKLNLEWLDKYGLTEEGDLLMLNHPEREILDTGGVIYLAKVGDAVAGSAALINESEGIFELAKMAVIDRFKGKGISKLLIEKCLDKATALGAKKIYLQSNSQLTTALALYEKYGFRHIPVVNSHYANADVMMEKIIG